MKRDYCVENNINIYVVSAYVQTIDDLIELLSINELDECINYLYNDDIRKMYEDTIEYMRKVGLKNERSKC